MGKVMGFKVYFNTTKLKFMCEKTASEVGDGNPYVCDSCVFWSDTYQHGVATTEDLNDKLEKKQIYVRICRACGTPFMMDEREIGWYDEKGYRLPRRCYTCRKKYPAKKLYNDQMDSMLHFAHPIKEEEVEEEG